MPYPLKYYRQMLQGVDPQSFSTLGCLRPRKIFVFNSATCKNEPLYVDCGKCINCADQRRNELATRMILHSKSEPWEFVYFVTLTYSSVNWSQYKEHPFLDDWLKTYPVCDCGNSTHRPRWTPSIIAPEHVQKFFKRLRKEHPDNIISYAFCSELGGTYGRPHHHLIVWTTKKLDKYDFQKAWSYKCVRTKDPKVFKRYNGKQKSFFYSPIGNVDFNDLVLNHTCDFDAPLEKGTSKSAQHCFSYVAKYVCKGMQKLNKHAYRRLHAVYDKLPEMIDYTSGITDDLIEQILHPETIDKSQLSFAELQRLVNLPDSLRQFVIAESYKLKTCKRLGVNYENVNFSKFKELFSSYFSFSRKYALGKGYFEENKSRFIAADFSLRQVQSKNLVFPSYYFRLLSFEKYSVYFRSTTLQSKSLVKGFLPIVQRFFHEFRDNRALSRFNTCDYCRTSVPTFEKDIIEGLYETICNNGETQRVPVTSPRIDPVSRSPIACDRNQSERNQTSLNWINRYIPERGKLTDISIYRRGKMHNYFYDETLDMFLDLVFDRSANNYFVQDYVPRIDMCDLVLDNIKRYYNELPKMQFVKSQKLDMMNRMEQYITRPLVNFSGVAIEDAVFINVNTDARLAYIESRTTYQHDYVSQHLTKDNL